jgi:hypothetical protein
VLQVYRPRVFLTIFLLGSDDQILMLDVIAHRYLPFGLANCLIPAQRLGDLFGAAQSLP